MAGTRGRILLQLPQAPTLLLALVAAALLLAAGTAQALESDGAQAESATAVAGETAAAADERAGGAAGHEAGVKPAQVPLQLPAGTEAGMKPAPAPSPQPAGTKQDEAVPQVETAVSGGSPSQTPSPQAIEEKPLPRAVPAPSPSPAGGKQGGPDGLPDLTVLLVGTDGHVFTAYAGDTSPVMAVTHNAGDGDAPASLTALVFADAAEWLKGLPQPQLPAGGYKYLRPKGLSF